MGHHVYLDPGPRRTTVQPGHVSVELDDASDHIQLTYRGCDGLDALNETIFLFMQARSQLVAGLVGEADECEAHHLGEGDTIAMGGEVCTVRRIVLTVTECTIVAHPIDALPTATRSYTVGRHSSVRRLHNVPSVPCLVSV